MYTSKFYKFGLVSLLVFAGFNILIVMLYMTQYSQVPQSTNDIPAVCNHSTITGDIAMSKTSLANTVNLTKTNNYIINGSSICNKSSHLQLLVAIITPQENYHKRVVLRQTWTKLITENPKTALMFFMGIKPTTKTNISTLIEEKQHHDMVIADFDDTYRNLSLKIFQMLHWVHDYCPNVHYVLKCDDDMFINVYNLLNFINSQQPDLRSFHGKLKRNILPVRNVNSPYAKWLLRREEYPGLVFPAYVSGPSYLIGTASISDLLTVCARLPYLYLEDVFITGVCASQSNYSRRNNAQFFNDVMPSSRSPCSILSLISVHQVNSVNMKKFWNVLSNIWLYKAWCPYWTQHE